VINSDIVDKKKASRMRLFFAFRVLLKLNNFDKRLNCPMILEVRIFPFWNLPKTSPGISYCFLRYNVSLGCHYGVAHVVVAIKEIIFKFIIIQRIDLA